MLNWLRGLHRKPRCDAGFLEELIVFRADARAASLLSKCEAQVKDFAVNTNTETSRQYIWKNNSVGFEICSNETQDEIK